MSRGPGTAQRAIEAAFLGQPSHRFGLDELCSVVYPDAEAHTATQRKTVARAAASVARRLGWQTRQTGANNSRHLKKSIVYVNPAHAADRARAAREARTELGA